MPLTSDDISASTQLVINTFKEMRPLLMQNYGSINHLIKTDSSPVTELDITVETTLKERLLSAFPHIGFHGEETDDIESTSGATWIVDPIDGTSSFIHGLPYCTNMAGLVVDGVIVSSVIYQFVTDDLYTAIRGSGAFKNNEKITVKNTGLSNSIVFSGSFVYKNMYHLFAPHNIGVYAPIGASGYEYTRLAQGSIQCVTKLHCKSQIHDNVPGVLLAQEAGARVISFEDKDHTYETLNFVIGTPNIMDVISASKADIVAILQS